MRWGRGGERPLAKKLTCPLGSQCVADARQRADKHGARMLLNVDACGGAGRFGGPRTHCQPPRPHNTSPDTQHPCPPPNIHPHCSPRPTRPEMYQHAPAAPRREASSVQENCGGRRRRHAWSGMHVATFCVEGDNRQGLGVSAGVLNCAVRSVYLHLGCRAVQPTWSALTQESHFWTSNAKLRDMAVRPVGCQCTLPPLPACPPSPTLHSNLLYV